MELNNREIGLGESAWIKLKEKEQKIEYLWGLKGISTHLSETHGHMVFENGKETYFRNIEGVQTQKINGTLIITSTEDAYGVSEIMLEPVSKRLMLRTHFGCALLTINSSTLSTTSTAFTTCVNI